MQSFQNCIGPTIRIAQEILCLPYAGFFLLLFFLNINHATSSNLNRSYYPHWSREFVSPVCGIFFNLLTFSANSDSILGYFANMPIWGRFEILTNFFKLVKCSAEQT